MSMSRSLLPAVTLAFAAAGCAVPADTAPAGEAESIGEAQGAIRDVPPAGKNGKTGFCQWHSATRAAHLYIANQSLHAGSGNIRSVSVLLSCREEVLANMVECALTPWQSLYDPVLDKTYQGHWGLAPGWYDNPLSSNLQRRYVTACMVQRLNAGAVEVPILEEGASSPINYDLPCQADFPFFESVAYGDVFTSPGSPTQVVNVCYNDDLQRACHYAGKTPEDWLQERICDSSPTCGLTVVGKCSDKCVTGGTGYPICQQWNGTSDSATVKVRLPLGEGCGL